MSADAASVAGRPAGPALDQRTLGIILLMGLAQLLITSDFASLSVALPSIGAALDVSPATLSWVVSANAISFVGFMILGGRLTDTYGHRRCLSLGLVVFAVGSTLAGLADGLPMLVCARALQGLGAALVAPASFALINAFVPEGAGRRRALAIFGTMQGLSVILGLGLGGFVTSQLGWRAVFFVTLPFAVLALHLSLRLLPRRPSGPGRAPPLDLGGAILMMLSTGALLVAVSTLGERGAGSPLGLGLLAVAVGGFALFCAVEARTPEPLIARDLWRSPVLATAGLALAAVIGAVGGLFVLASLYMQAGLGLSPAAAGLGMIPVACGTILASQCSTFLLRVASARTVAIGGILLQIASLGALALALPTERYVATVAPFASLATFGSASAFIAIMGLVTSQFAADRQGAVSAMLFTGQQIALALGVATSLSIFRAAAVRAEEGVASYQTGFLPPMLFAAAGLLLALRTRGPSGPAEGQALRTPAGAGD